MKRAWVLGLVLWTSGMFLLLAISLKAFAAETKIDESQQDNVTTTYIADDAIVNADINSAAAIAGTKISPDFGAQNLVVDTDVFYVNSTTNNVGIGTTSPGEKLDVVGAIRTNNQLISTIATGTAPLSVLSTTKVASLNADLLDGLDSSGFGDATAANQTTIIDRVGTNADAASMASTLFGGQQYIWDNRASFGGGGDATAANQTTIINDTKYIYTNAIGGAPAANSIAARIDAAISSRLAASSYVTERGTDSAALASNYTATRAGYLDNLSGGAVALASNYTAIRAGYLDRLDTTISSRGTSTVNAAAYTDARAGYLDRIDTTVSSRAAAGDSSPDNWSCTVRSTSGTGGDTATDRTASCIGSEKVIAGGCYASWSNQLQGNRCDSWPANQGWTARFNINSDWQYYVYANCCN